MKDEYVSVQTTGYGWIKIKPCYIEGHYYSPNKKYVFIHMCSGKTHIVSTKFAKSLSLI